MPGAIAPKFLFRPHDDSLVSRLANLAYNTGIPISPRVYLFEKTITPVPGQSDKQPARGLRVIQ
jgi:hypothetical protein